MQFLWTINTSSLRLNCGQNALLLTFAIWRIILKAINKSDTNNLGEIIRRQRVAVPLTLRELTIMSGVSSSHMGRIEGGERFPSARVLRKIAKPLGFDEDELFTLVGYLSPQLPSIAEVNPGYSGDRVDPYVARVLGQEPVDVQRAVIGILTILKSLAKSMTKENR